MEILVLHPGALGDIILSLPALGLIRKIWPGARLALAANRDFADAVARAAVDRLLSFTAVPLHRIRPVGPLPESDRRFWGGYDLVLSWTGAGDPEFREGLKRANANSRVAAWRPGAGETRHVSRLFVDVLEPWLNAELSPGLPTIGLSSDAVDGARSWLESRGWRAGEELLAVHPGAGNREKRWPPDRFAELISARLPAGEQKAVIIEGPAEEGIGRRLASRLPGGSVLEVSGVPLATVAGVLSLCRAFVGNDSGVSHLAAALGLPTVALFGPTRPELWAPLGGDVRVLRQASACLRCRGAEDAVHSCMAALPVSAVLRELEPRQSISIPPFTSIDSPCR